MVKFGKYLESHQIPEWSTQYVRYKRLKKVLKQIELERAERDRQREENTFTGAPLTMANNTTPVLQPIQANATGTLSNESSVPADGKAAAPTLQRLPSSQPTTSSGQHAPATSSSLPTNEFPSNPQLLKFTAAQKKELDLIRAKQKLDRDSHPLRVNPELDLKVGQEWIQKSRAAVLAMEKQLEEQKKAEKEGRVPRRLSQMSLYMQDGDSMTNRVNTTIPFRESVTSMTESSRPALKFNSMTRPGISPITASPTVETPVLPADAMVSVLNNTDTTTSAHHHATSKANVSAFQSDLPFVDKEADLLADDRPEAHDDQAALDVALTEGKKHTTDDIPVSEDKYVKKLSKYIPPAICATFTKGEYAFFKLLEEDLETINHFFLKQEDFFLDKINIIVEQLDRLIREEEEQERARIGAKNAASNAQAKRGGGGGGGMSFPAATTAKGYGAAIKKRIQQLVHNAQLRESEGKDSDGIVNVMQNNMNEEAQLLSPQLNGAGSPSRDIPRTSRPPSDNDGGYANGDLNNSEHSTPSRMPLNNNARSAHLSPLNGMMGIMDVPEGTPTSSDGANRVPAFHEHDDPLGDSRVRPPPPPPKPPNTPAPPNSSSSASSSSAAASSSSAAAPTAHQMVSTTAAPSSTAAPANPFATLLSSLATHPPRDSKNPPAANKPTFVFAPSSSASSSSSSPPVPTSAPASSVPLPPTEFPPTVTPPLSKGYLPDNQTAAMRAQHSTSSLGPMDESAAPPGREQHPATGVEWDQANIKDEATVEMSERDRDSDGQDGDDDDGDDDDDDDDDEEEGTTGDNSRFDGGEASLSRRRGQSSSRRRRKSDTSNANEAASAAEAVNTSSEADPTDNIDSNPFASQQFRVDREERIAQAHRPGRQQPPNDQNEVNADGNNEPNYLDEPDHEEPQIEPSSQHPNGMESTKSGGTNGVSPDEHQNLLVPNGTSSNHDPSASTSSRPRRSSKSVLQGSKDDLSLLPPPASASPNPPSKVEPVNPPLDSLARSPLSASNRTLAAQNQQETSLAQHMHLHLKFRLLTAAKPWKVLEKALIELYRGLHLLRNYKILNFTAFVKILKKYDKIGMHAPMTNFQAVNFIKFLKVPFPEISQVNQMPSFSSVNSALSVPRSPTTVMTAESMAEELEKGWKAGAHLLPRIQSTHFLASPILRAFIRRVELIFASTFTQGDQKLALDNLRVVQPPMKSSVLFYLGLTLGVSGIMFLLLIIMISWIADALQANTHTTLSVSLPVWRGLGLVICAIWGWGVNVYLFHKYRINHEFIFEINPRTELKFEALMLIAATLTVIWFFLIDSFMFVSLAQSAGVWTQANTGFFPFTLFVVFFFIVFMPFDTFFRPTRYYILRTLAKIVTAPFNSVDFKDFYCADQLCSLVNVFNDIIYSFCFLFSGHFVLTESSDTQCLNFQKNAVWLVAVLPYWWRFLQSLRKYRDNPPANQRQLYNAGKYFSSICTTILSLLNKTYPNSAFRPLWITVATLTTCYTYGWDIYCDWGFLRFEDGSNTPKFLRRKLVLNNHFPYYFAIVSNLFLRVAWVFSISPTNFGVGLQTDYFNTVVWFLEVVRRQQWNFYRLENEHLTNCEHYRVVNIVPLKMDLLPNPSPEPEKKEEEKSRKSRQQLTEKSAGAHDGESLLNARRFSRSGSRRRSLIGLESDGEHEEEAVSKATPGLAGKPGPTGEIGTLEPHVDEIGGGERDESTAPLLAATKSANRLAGFDTNLSTYNGMLLTAPDARNLNPDRHDDPDLHDLTFHPEEEAKVITSPVDRQQEDAVAAQIERVMAAAVEQRTAEEEAAMEGIRIHLAPEDEPELRINATSDSQLSQPQPLSRDRSRRYSVSRRGVEDMATSPHSLRRTYSEPAETNVTPAGSEVELANIISPPQQSKRKNKDLSPEMRSTPVSPTIHPLHIPHAHTLTDLQRSSLMSSLATANATAHWKRLHKASAADSARTFGGTPLSSFRSRIADFSKSPPLHPKLSDSVIHRSRRLASTHRPDAATQMDDEDILPSFQYGEGETSSAAAKGVAARPETPVIVVSSADDKTVTVDPRTVNASAVLMQPSVPATTTSGGGSGTSTPVAAPPRTRDQVADDIFDRALARRKSVTRLSEPDSEFMSRALAGVVGDRVIEQLVQAQVAEQLQAHSRQGSIVGQLAHSRRGSSQFGGAAPFLQPPETQHFMQVPAAFEERDGQHQLSRLGPSPHSRTSSPLLNTVGLGRGSNSRPETPHGADHLHIPEFHPELHPELQLPASLQSASSSSLPPQQSQQ